MAQRRRRRAKHSDSEIAAILAEYEASDLTQRDFARQRGISYWSLKDWLYKKRHEGLPEPSRLVEVRAAESSARRDDSRLLEIQLPGGIVLRAHESLSPQALAELVSALRHSCSP